MEAALITRIGADLSDLRNKMSQAQGLIGGFQDKISAIGPTVAAAFSVGAIVAFGKAAVDAAGQAVDGENRLLVALKGREDIQARLIRQASDIAERTLFEDDAIVQQQALLAAMGRTEAQIRKIIEAAVQLSSATGTELGGSVEALNKSYEGLDKGLRAIDPTLHGLTKAQLEHGEAVDLVIQKYKGFAEVAAETGSGPAKQFHKLLGEIQEDIGREILPRVNEGLKGLIDVVKAFTADDISTLAKIAAFIGYVPTGGASLSNLIDYNKELEYTKKLLDEEKASGVPAPFGGIDLKHNPFGADKAARPVYAGKKSQAAPEAGLIDNFTPQIDWNAFDAELERMRTTQVTWNQMLNDERAESDKAYTDLLQEENDKRTTMAEEAMNRQASIATMAGQQIGSAFGLAAAGQITFTQAVERSTASLLRSFASQALGGLIARTFETLPFPLNLGVIAAGQAFIDSFFGSLAFGGGGGGGGGGGYSPQVRNNGSLLNGSTQAVQISGRTYIEGNKLAVVWGRAEETNSYTRPVFGGG